MRIVYSPAVAVKRRGRSARHTAKRNGGSRGFEALWSSRTRAAPGPKPVLSLERTLQAAVAVADAEGLTAVTMSRVAEELGVTTMALYRYVAGKQALVDLMSDSAIGEPPPQSGLGWRNELAAWARADLAALLRHPWLLESIAGRVTVGPHWVEWVDAAIRALSTLALTAREVIAVVLMVDGHARSTAQIAVGLTGTGEWAANFARVLEVVSGDERYRALATVAAAGGFDPPAKREDDPFEFGLQRLLDGVEAFSRARATGPQRRRQRPTA